jgi:phosphopantothenoylcysteine decarboxylase/phosphopantothenate--cysteine ligase
MYLNPATQSNIETLRSRGITVLEPDHGRLTGKDSGIGRFPETSRIIESVNAISGREARLLGKKVVITAGGTVEAIDPVRFIGNRSSGRQGLAIAYEALREGADVTLICAQTEEFSLEGIKRIDVASALEMQQHLTSELSGADALVMAAAVADARPISKSTEKIEKATYKAIELTENPDLLAEAARGKLTHQVFVGFAAETGAGIRERGLKKLHSKGVDLLYVTDVSGGKVFGEELTTGSLLSKRGDIWDFVGVDKFELARKIVGEIAKEMEMANG